MQPIYLDLSVLREFVVNIIFLSLFVDAGNEEDPALDAALRPRFPFPRLVNPLVLSLLTGEKLSQSDCQYV